MPSAAAAMYAAKSQLSLDEPSLPVSGRRIGREPPAPAPPLPPGCVPPVGGTAVSAGTGVFVAPPGVTVTVRVPVGVTVA